MNEAAIRELAAAAGLMRDWIDANGRPQQVGTEALQHILAALGLPCRDDMQCRDSHTQLMQAAHRLPPLVTGTVDQALRLPPAPQLSGLPYRINLEGGGQIDGRFGDDAQAGAWLPAIARHGYHRLLAGDIEITLAIAPPRCFGVADALHLAPPRQPRLWGLGVQLYSLRRAGDGGIGDFGALSQLARSAAGRGAGALAISPVHAMFSADLQRYSPYGPSSRLFLNVLHIDPTAVLGADALNAALRGLGEDARNEMARLEQSELIDWPRAAALKLRLLRALFERFEAGAGPDQRAAFDAFRRDGGEALEDHARFEALQAWRLAQGESGYWRHWPDALRDPRAAGVRSFAQEHAREVDFHAFLQWQAARGLAGAQQAACEAGMPVGLITDLAVGADDGGSQAWSRQEELLHGLSVGAPPDALNARGQAWGLGAFSPHAMRSRGFHAYIEMLRAIFAYAGGARIDHVLGLGRLWLVPEGAAPTEGAYLRYPMPDLLRLIALESWRHRAIVIGEDLGTVPEGFDAQLAAAGLLGIRVLLFQQWGGRFFAPREWSRDAIATTTTHDLPTVAGWWQGRDIDWRAKLGLLDVGQNEEQARAGRAHERGALWQAMVEAGIAHGAQPPAEAAHAPLTEAAGFIGATPVPLAMLPIEDALGLVEQPNLPGTVDDHPNWRRRLPEHADTVLEHEAVAQRLARLDRARRERTGGE
jgi:4-alpha-glucanotransferase